MWYADPYALTKAELFCIPFDEVDNGIENAQPTWRDQQCSFNKEHIAEMAPNGQVVLPLSYMCAYLHIWSAKNWLF